MTKQDFKRALKKFIPQALVTATRPARRFFHPQRRFDRRFNVDTGGFVELAELGISNEDAAGYEATTRSAFVRILSSLRLHYENFTFLDMGSGKGAVLLYASEFPFKRVIGVEFASALHEIAERNIVSYRSRTVKCRNVTSLCMDATAYPIPAEPVVFYFGNPFKGAVLQTVRTNIEKSVLQHPREVIIIYHHPLSRHAHWDHAEFLEVSRRARDHSVYTSRAQTR
jgi:16S rRNA G966 N2-methylase RsmD